MEKKLFVLFLLSIILAFSLFTLAACSDDAIVSIEAVFTQGDNVIYEKTNLDALRPYLKVYAVRDGGDKREITDYQLSGSLDVGTSSVTVSYDCFEANFTVNVSPTKIISISARYNQGEKPIYTSSTLDSLKENLLVEGCGKDGRVFKISDYTLTGNLTPGSSVITVSYGGFEASFSVNVTEVAPASISISTKPTKTHYIETEAVDLAGLKLLVHFNDESSIETTDFSYEKSAVSFGDTYITVSYGSLTINVPITVEKKIIALAVSKNPDKLSYVSGERLDLTGTVITAKFLDGTYATVDAVPNIQNGACILATDTLRYSLQGVSVTVLLQISYVTLDGFRLSYTYEGGAASFKISKYLGAEKKVTVPEACNGIPITEIDSFAFIDSSLVSIKIGENVTRVHANSFVGCENTIICAAFPEKPSGWASDSISRAPVIWAYHDIVVDDYFDYVISGGKAYITAYKVQSPIVVIPETIKDCPVVSICTAFYENENLTNIALPDSLEEIGDYTFAKCKNLAGITIPRKITSIGKHAFEKCENLSYVYLPTSIEKIGDGAFLDCSKLTSIALSDKIAYIPDYAFNGCTSLKSFVIPESVTVIGEGAFINCQFESIHIPASITKIGTRAFGEFINIKSITVSSDNPYYKDIDGNLYTKDGKTLLRYAAGKPAVSFKIPESVTHISAEAFAGCRLLKEIIFENPNSWYCGTDVALSVTDLQDAQKAAVYLISTYRYYSWTQR